MSVSSYLLSNTAAQTGPRFDALAWTYDTASTRALAATGVGPGWRCWEVGGGGGGIGARLAERVGFEGSVLVTDIDPQWMRDIEAAPNVILLYGHAVSVKLAYDELSQVCAPGTAADGCAQEPESSAPPARTGSTRRPARSSVASRHIWYGDSDLRSHLADHCSWGLRTSN